MSLPGAEVFERAGLEAWPGIEVDWDGHWVRRAANGYTKRANSVQSLDRADDSNVSERLAAAVDWFRARQLRPVFRVTPLAGPNTLVALDALGWQKVDASYQYAMPLGATEPHPRGEIFSVLDPRFLAVQQQLRSYDQTQLDKLKALLAALTVSACGIVLYDETGAAVASALMAIGNAIVVTGNVVTDPAQRRRGHAAAMMATGHAWAHANGATIAALNVQVDNPAAQALYRGLGYTHQYDYHYRIAGHP